MDSKQELQRAKVNQNSWKLALTRQITNLEDNLDQLYHIVNLKYTRIVINEALDEPSLNAELKDLAKKETGTYENIIEDHLGEISKSASIIGNLIICDAEFDLPLPVLVLLRLASKIGSLRWHDFTKKIPGTLAKKHVYNKTSFKLLQISLTLFRWISSSLGTDVLPFQPLINEFNLNLLEWTRTSHLEKHDGLQYYWLRSLIFMGISWELAQFSVNVNYGPEQLKALIETELLDELVEVLGRRADPNSVNIESLKDKYACDSLDCLDWVFITYSRLLDAKLEYKLKDYVIHTCLDIYRNFETTMVSLVCRKHLLRLLVTIANQPFATSTTELASNVIELASKLESDHEVFYLTRKAMDLGLAHRPSIIMSREYYAPCLSREKFVSLAPEAVCSDSNSQTDHQPVHEQIAVVHEQTAAVNEQTDDCVDGDTDGCIPVEQPPSNTEPQAEDCPSANEQTDDGLDPQVEAIVSLFVNKPAD